MRNFFVYSMCLFFFLNLLFWFGSLMLCLSVCLLLFFFSYGHSKQRRSLLLLDQYYSAWRAICDSHHRFYPRPENLFRVM